MALGSDTGASVRLPASFTGVSGLRPTFGSVSNRGSFPLSPSHDIIGPMARSAEEVALLYAVIAGYDPADPHSEDVELPNFLPRLRDPIAGLRIGRPRNHYFDNLSDAVGKAVEEAIRTLERLGAQIVDVDVPGASVVPDWYPIIMISDARDLHAERLQHDTDNWDPQTLARMQVGARYTGADYAHALRKREQWCITLGQVFSDVDVLLSPTCPIVAPGIDDPRGLFEISKALTQNTVLGPFGRIPGLSVPCGFSQEGLPIGLQLESARWNDALLLQAGVAFQSVTQWHEHRPQLKA